MGTDILECHNILSYQIGESHLDNVDGSYYCLSYSKNIYSYTVCCHDLILTIAWKTIWLSTRALEIWAACWKWTLSRATETIKQSTPFIYPSHNKKTSINVTDVQMKMCLPSAVPCTSKYWSELKFCALLVTVEFYKKNVQNTKSNQFIIETVHLYSLISTL